MDEKRMIGFSCAYTPLPLIHAAGFAPYRVLPAGDAPDQAGLVLHDNLCPHVKRILDRAMAGDLPELAGMVFMNSCDAMRRLYDAWRSVLPDMPSALIDLPVHASESSVRFFADEIRRLAGILPQWGGKAITADGVREGVSACNRISGLLADLRGRVISCAIDGGSAVLQNAYNLASTESPALAAAHIEKILSSPPKNNRREGIPVYLFGNILAEPGAFELFESCGARIIGEDLCTGSRLFTPLSLDDGGEPLTALARSILNRQPCARTFSHADPGMLAGHVVSDALACGAKGVIAHTVKFCDPYLARLPYIREALRGAGLPFLHLEGDCTLRSMGQQRTRIEAFIEMLR